MPLNAARLLASRFPVDVDLGPDVGILPVVFYPARITTQLLFDLTDLNYLTELTEERARELLTTLPDKLLAVMHSWDLVETNLETGVDEPVPLTRAQLVEKGLALQMAIMKSITHAQREASVGEAPAPEAVATSASAPSSGAS